VGVIENRVRYATSVLASMLEVYRYHQSRVSACVQRINDVDSSRRSRLCFSNPDLYPHENG
jgi:hypothetical protein